MEDPLEPYYYQNEEQQICGLPVPPITDEFIENYPSVVDRFFTRYYYIKENADGSAEPYKVLYHSNRICLICLAPEHPALSAGVNDINYDIGNLDRSKNIVKGKGKKGGMVLSPETTLAVLTAADNKVYKIPSCLRSKLIEVNTNLIENPKHLESSLEGEGYLAIVQFNLGLCDVIKASLLTQEDYDRKIHAVGNNFNQ